MVGAMAENSILQIVVFSLFVGIALTAIGERGKPIVTVIEAMVELMLQVTGYVMRVAPFAVFGALASVVTRSEEHTSELQSLMRISYAVFCLKKKNLTLNEQNIITIT